MKRSKIGWTDYSGENANFVWRGSDPQDCKCSPGCEHCYVDRIIGRLGNRWPEQTSVYPEKLARLLNTKFNTTKGPYRRGVGSKPMVFVCDTGDLFHHLVPLEIIYKALDGFRARYDVTWQLLTKRASRANRLVTQYCRERHIYMLPKNIWFGVTTENQETYYRRFPFLDATPAATKWLSLEPLLGPVAIEHALATIRDLDWLVVGGESGVDARPMHPNWARVIRDTAKVRGSAFFFKQWGEYRPASSVEEADCFMNICRGQTVALEGLTFYKVGRHIQSTLDGETHWEFPR